MNSLWAEIIKKYVCFRIDGQQNCLFSPPMPFLPSLHLVVSSSLLVQAIHCHVCVCVCACSSSNGRSTEESLEGGKLKRWPVFCNGDSVLIPLWLLKNHSSPYVIYREGREGSEGAGGRVSVQVCVCVKMADILFLYLQVIKCFSLTLSLNKSANSFWI